MKWVKVPFNNSYAPGEKKFDFDINQISITPARQKVVDFSDGYYTAAQAVITLKADAANAASLADLKELKLGAQTGTTSLTAIREDIAPTQEPLVFQNTNVAKQALLTARWTRSSPTCPRRSSSPPSRSRRARSRASSTRPVRPRSSAC